MKVGVVLAACLPADIEGERAVSDGCKGGQQSACSAYLLCCGAHGCMSTPLRLLLLLSIQVQKAVSLEAARAFGELGNWGKGVRKR